MPTNNPVTKNNIVHVATNNSVATVATNNRVILSLPITLWLQITL